MSTFEPPERIWLQTHDEEGEPHDTHDGTVTWCADRQHETDVGYVRVDKLERYRAALGEIRTELDGYSYDVPDSPLWATDTFDRICREHDIDLGELKENGK